MSIVLHDTSHGEVFNRMFRAHDRMAVTSVFIDEARPSKLTLSVASMLHDLRTSFADLGALDAAAYGQARKALLALVEEQPAPIVAPKPVNPRVTGEDIRRFIPRRI